MRNIVKIAQLLLLPVLAHAQLSNIDSTRNVFKYSKDAAERYKAALYIYVFYQETNRDTALYYTEQQLSIATHEHNNIGDRGCSCQ